MLHLKGCAKTRTQRWGDWLLIVFGVAATIYTSVGTIKVSFFNMPSVKTVTNLTMS